jgi:thiamine pyrophosphokinase
MYSIKNRCVIVGGADIKNYEYITAQLRDGDYMVYCDSGLRHLPALGADPDLIVGDFDSHINPRLDVETIVLPCEKDDTDTFFAAKECISRGFRDFWLIGVAGGRLDHTLANLSILLHLDSLGCRGVITDDYSCMEIVSRSPVRIGGEHPYFSLLNISGQAEGITVTGAKYSLTDGCIKPEYQYGVSNEVLHGQTAEVSLKRGKLLLVRILPECRC